MSGRIQKGRRRSAGRNWASVVLVSFFLIALATGVLLMVSSSAESKAAASETRTVVVARGDTLWSIAERHAPAGTDLRQYVFAMRKLNNLSDAMILPGQTITLP